MPALLADRTRGASGMLWPTDSVRYRIGPVRVVSVLLCMELAKPNLLCSRFELRWNFPFRPRRLNNAPTRRRRRRVG